MVILITGDGHTGKTLLAQKLLERYGYPYLSIDHLKMGLIRSGQTALTPESSESELTAYLWPIVCEIVKTNIENNQNLIIEGCYIPFDYKDKFSPEYLKNIRFVCLIFSRQYIAKHFDDIIRYENVIEQRGYDSELTIDGLTVVAEYNLNACKTYGLDYILIEEDYSVDYFL